jgi:hypothetical protein
MENKDKEYMRFIAACFAMNGIIQMLKGGQEQLVAAQTSGAESAVQWADKLMEELQNEETVAGGIVDIVTKRKRRTNS